LRMAAIVQRELIDPSLMRPGEQAKSIRVASLRLPN
jgi:hypothetical protein